MVRETARGTWEIVRWTVPGTDPRPEGNRNQTGHGRAARAALLVLAAWAVWTFPTTRFAHAQEPDTVLPGSGILYPDGFDQNTIGEVRGKAFDLTRPGRGPVRFRLVSGRETYTVLACPPWMWNDLEVDLPDGTEVRVTGSKSLGRDGNLYVIAQEMDFPGSGRSIAFRDGRGFPLWKGSRGKMTGTGRGMGSPMGGTGGSPSGRGSRGGRR